MMIRHGIIFLLLIPLFCSCTVKIGEREFLHPHRIPDAPQGVTSEGVSIQTKDGVILKGFFIRKQGNGRAMIYFYGNNEDVLNTTPLLSLMVDVFNVDILVMDYRGYGFSNGISNIFKMSEDAIASYDYLAGRLREGMPVFVFGRSLGTAFALDAGINRTVAGVILQSPFTSPADVVEAWEDNIPWYVRWLVDLRLDNEIESLAPKPLDIIKELHSPLIIIHGEKDTVIPLAHGLKMFENSSSKQKSFLRLENQGHNDILPVVGKPKQAIEEFLDKYGRVNKSDEQGSR